MRYLSFNTIAKKCPKGTWLDKQSGKCIPIDEWKSKYGGKRERTDENGDKPKRCPKGKWKDPATGECISQDEWKRRNGKGREKEKPAEQKDKKVGTKHDITPDTSGIAKAPILQITRGFVHGEIQQAFNDQISKKSHIVNTLKDFKEEDNFYDTIHTAFEDTEIYTNSDIEKIDKSGQKMVAEDISDVISEYPVGLIGMKGLIYDDGENSSTLMYYSPKDSTIHFNGKYYKEGGHKDSYDDKVHDVNTVSEYQKAYDPILKKDADEWSWHPHGMKTGQAFSHEYGHNMMYMLFRAQTKVDKYYKKHPEEIPESYTKRKEEREKKRSDFDDEIGAFLSELDVDGHEHMLYSYDGSVKITLNVNEDQLEEDDDWGYVMTAGNERYQKVLKFMKDHGFERKGRKIMKPEFIGHNENGKEAYYLQFEFEDPHREYAKFKEHYPSPSIVKLMNDNEEMEIKGISRVFDGDFDFDVSEDYQSYIINECEELYKEIYSVDELIPSDVYTGYGYFGPTQSFSKGDTYYDYRWGKRGKKKDELILDRKKKHPVDMKEKKYTNQNTIAGERIAEAFNDVIVRKDKANSMSVLIVSAVEYEYYKLISGTEESFSEFLRANYDFNEAGQPIIKTTRYLLFT